jgi:hypothetical protein
MATVSLLYGARTVMAVTALQSLASSATVGWKSALTDNTSALALDYEVYVSLTTAITAPANDKAMYVYVAPAHKDNGGTFRYTDGGTGTLPTSADAGYTIASPNDLRLIGVLNYTTANMTCQGVFTLSNAVGLSMPQGFLIVIVNFSGAALSTGCVVEVMPVNQTVV